MCVEREPSKLLDRLLCFQPCSLSDVTWWWTNSKEGVAFADSSVWLSAVTFINKKGVRAAQPIKFLAAMTGTEVEKGAVGTSAEWSWRNGKSAIPAP